MRSVKSITAVLFFLFIIIADSNYSNETEAKSRQSGASIALTYNADIYLNSKGGPLKNGCEGWATSLNTGEYIFASRCDSARLERLGLFADAALKYNTGEILQRRIALKEKYIMIDFTNEKNQALFGLTSEGTQVYIIVNKDKKYIYYKASGSVEQLKRLNLSVNELLKANNNLDNKKRIIVNNYLTVAENKSDSSQMLIGKCADGKKAGVIIDKDKKTKGIVYY